MVEIAPRRSNVSPLCKAITALRPDDFERIVLWATAAEKRDPKISPAYLDKLMASAGGAAARYLQVRCFDGETVFCFESNLPFSNNGKPRQIPIKKWQAWASKASIEHRASRETSVPGLSGYWTHWEILNAIETIAEGH